LCANYCAENPLVKSKETERLLRGAVTQFGLYLQRPAQVSDFKANTFTAFLRHRRKIGRAESTIEREAAKLMTLWRWAALNGMTQPPRIRVQKAQVDTPVSFLRCELRRLFREAKRYNRRIGGVSGDVVLTAMLSTIWDTASRIGELRALDRLDMDVSGPWWRRRGWLTLRHRKRNGRTLVRPVRWSTMRRLRRLLAATDAQKPFAIVDRTTLYGHLDRVLMAAGLPTDRKHKFHCVRRSHASYLHRAGGDSQSSLDHADPQTTRLRYYDPRVTERKTAIDYLFSPLGWWDCVLAWMGW
jgi:integrase